MQATILTQPSTLKKNLGFGITPAMLILIAIMILSLGLHFYNIESIGDSNAYYTAAVESMTQSWHNFFFVAAEPGGSVTVDKPPLGLWIEAAFAYFLGVSGFTTALPNILAGVAGIPILYHLVKKYAGELAGLVAVLVMTITPVYLATNRNNTMDELLLFFLLLAAWAFIKATETENIFWVLLGAFIVGLGFNIKMSQAFLPLPAFYTLYFFGSKSGWGRKIISLSAATILLIVVSLSWAVIVDLVPADSRPFIGSSKDNSVMSLIMEHNGGSRLVSGGRPQNAPQNADGQMNQPPQANQRLGNAPQEAINACANLSLGDACSFTLQNGNVINGSCITPPNQNFVACVPQGMGPQQDGQQPMGGGPQNAPQNNDGQMNQQTQANQRPDGAPQEAIDACANLSLGNACSFTLQDGNVINGSCITPPNQNFVACAPQGMRPQQDGQQPNGQPPMGNAPNDRGGTPFNNETGEPGVFRFFTSPLSKQMSWLLPFALISIILSIFAAKIQIPFVSGIHKAAILWGGWLLTCVVFFSMISEIFHSYYAIMLVPPLAAMVGIGFALLWSWSVDKTWVSGFLIGAVIITLTFQTFAIFQYEERSLWMFGAAILFGLGVMLVGFQKRAAYLLILSAMLVIPAYWTFMTVASSADQNLPSAYSGNTNHLPPRMQNIQRNTAIDEAMLNQLQADTQGMKYLLAVPSSQQGAEIVLATGRPVLYMGGFGGQDDVVSADDLQQMVTNGELRYILYGDERGQKQGIANWLKTSCTVVTGFSQTNNGAPNQGGRMSLYQCE